MKSKIIDSLGSQEREKKYNPARLIIWDDGATMSNEHFNKDVSSRDHYSLKTKVFTIGNKGNLKSYLLELYDDGKALTQEQVAQIAELYEGARAL